MCVRKQCFYFIVTSYQHWSFGVFSDGNVRKFIFVSLLKIITRMDESLYFTTV